MNEFIVWDKDNKVWVGENYPFYINRDGFLCIKRDDGVMQIENDCEIFNYIGKTDINNKKIYANCSIVEFEYIHHKEGFVKAIAKIVYDNYHCKYKFIPLDGNFIQDYITIANAYEIKIIDTIQENKLGLI